MFYLVFIFGLVFGSFLNVIVYRLKSGGSNGLSRSFCPNCRTILRWYDLIPIFSFIFLRGRCRYCHKKISWQYPIVETLSGLVWVLVAYKSNFQFSIFNFQSISNFQFLNFIYYIFILSALLVIAVYDFKWKIIPDKIIYPAIVVVLIFNLFEISKYQNITIFLWPLLVAIIAFLFLFLIFYFSKGRTMGLGDAKLAFLIGLFLSPLLAIAAFMLAFIIGAAFGIILIGLGKIFSHYKKWGMKSQISFGPFLVLGAFLAFFFSNLIIKLLNMLFVDLTKSVTLQAIAGKLTFVYKFNITYLILN